MIYEKPEFTPDPNSSKPALPGEFGGGELGIINGKIYDINLGREFEVKSWKDATRYYIRQNIERPLVFLKDRLKEQKLQQHVMDTEVNPINFICHSNVKPVHNSSYGVNQEPQPSSLAIGQLIEEFKNGKFFFQYYFRFEELTQNNDKYYNSDLIERKLTKMVDGAVSGDFGQYVPGGWLQDILGDQIIDPDENPFDNGGTPGWNNPYEPPEGLGAGGKFTVHELYLRGLLNIDNIDQLWKNMSNDDDDFAGGNYGISSEDQNAPFNKFFKSIKLGVRLCYAAATTTQEDEDGLPIIDSELFGPPQSEGIKKLFNQIDSIMSDPHLIGGELYNYTQEEKILRITEVVAPLAYSVDADSGIAVPGLDSYEETTYIFPVISEEIDLTEKILETPFALNVSEYNNLEYPKSIKKMIQDYVKDGDGKKIIEDLVSKMFDSMDIQALYTYAIPIPKLVTMFLIYNILGVDTDTNILQNYNPTKEIFTV